MFGGTKLIYVCKEGLKLEETEEEKRACEEEAEWFEGLCEVVKDAPSKKSKRS